MLLLELVSIENDVPKTTSLKVAEFFGKRHTEVLRKIDLLDCSEEFSKRNFALADYIDEQGKKRRMVSMTKDGFTFLAMGFTGKKAAHFKENYINAFNYMADLLSQRNNSLMYQYNEISFNFKLATQNASEAGRALNWLGKQVKPSMRERLENLEKQMQMVLDFGNKKAEQPLAKELCSA